MIPGTPAMTMTLPMRKPGALEIGFAMRSAPAGMRAMRRRASFRSSGLWRSSSIAFGARIDVDRDAEGRGDAIGGDVVVRRTDAAGGEEIGVGVRRALTAATMRSASSGTMRTSLRSMPTARAVIGDRADVLVLGAPGQDLVADDEDRRR